jgi:RHS repeat-associated protein
VEDRRDAAQTMHRRNRQYDPATGRFTQEDPIGLGGGLNLYGFADGDPVNYSDPFGLCGLPGAVASVAMGAALGAATGGYSLGAAAADAASGALCAGALSKVGKVARMALRYGDEAADAGRVASFTARNFRRNLGAATGGVRQGSHAHHLIPQEFHGQLREMGVRANFNNPRFGAWWEAGEHLSTSRAYNDDWRRFLQKTRTEDEVLDFARTMGRRYGLDFNF